MYEANIPKNINLTVDGVPWSFALCVQWVVDNSTVFNGKMSTAAAAIRILNAIAGKSEDDAFSWLDDDRKMLADAFEDPPKKWCPPLRPLGSNAADAIAVPARMFQTYFDVVTGVVPQTEAHANGVAPGAVATATPS